MAVDTIQGLTMLAPKGVAFVVKARLVEVDNPELVVILTPSPGEGGTNEPQKRKRTTDEWEPKGEESRAESEGEDEGDEGAEE